MMPERLPSLTPISIRPVLMAVTARQFTAVPTPPPTRGMMLRSGVSTGTSCLAGASRSYAVMPEVGEPDWLHDFISASGIGFFIASPNAFRTSFRLLLIGLLRVDVFRWVRLSAP